MVVRSRSILYIMFAFMSIGPVSAIFADESVAPLPLFWLQALTFMQYTYDEYTALETISSRLERVHNTRTPNANNTLHNNIERYVTRSLWQHMQHKCKEQNMVDLEIAMLGERAQTLERNLNQSDLSRLVRDFYQMVYQWCSKNHISQLTLVDNVSIQEYQYQTDLLLKKIEQRAKQGIIPQTFFEKVTDKLLTSSIITNILPTVLPIVIRIVVFYLLWGHFDECVSYIEQIALSSSEVVASGYGTLLKNTVHTAQSLLFAETIVGGVCSIWQAMIQPIYQRKAIYQARQKQIQENRANQIYIPKCSFEDIIGYETVKKECSPIIESLKNPLITQMHHIVMPVGLLICGPKGVGKRNFAQAIACEAKLSLINIKTTDFLMKNGGERITELFNEARIVAPAMILIDDMSGLFAHVSLDDLNNAHNALGVLLNEIDRVRDQQIYRPIIVVTTARDKKELNPLLEKCFERVINMPFPDATTRSQLFMHYLRDDKNISSFDFTELATISCNMSGKKIKEVVDRAHEKELMDHLPFLTMEILADLIHTLA